MAKGFPPGNFAGLGSEIVVEKLGIGEFGYAPKLALTHNRDSGIFLQPKSTISRTYNRMDHNLRVEMTSCGLEVSLLDPELRFYPWWMSAPRKRALRVRSLIAGSKRHNKWNEALFVPIVGLMKRGQQGYVVTDWIDNLDGRRPSVSGEVDVLEAPPRSSQGRSVLVRRRRLKVFELCRDGQWIPLTVTRYRSYKT